MPTSIFTFSDTSTIESTDVIITSASYNNRVDELTNAIIGDGGLV